MLKKIAIFIVASLGMSSYLYAYTANELATEKYFDTIENSHRALKEFLVRMPKGADLHNHLSGASKAENLIKYALHDVLCVDPVTDTILVNPNCAPEDLLTNFTQSQSNDDALINAWSMRHFHAGNESGHDHFFAAFHKFGEISWRHNPEMLAEVANRAAKQNENYLELMSTLDGNASGELGQQLGWSDDFDLMRDRLLSNGLIDIVTTMTQAITTNETKQRQLLLCETDGAKPGCAVKIRYLYQVLREQAPEKVFAQLLAGFEGATRDPRIVGINLVQREDGTISMRDYELQMRMIQYFHTIYPAVHISLHAGELTPDVVSNDGLQFHIHDAVDVANANRIGHGVDITHEKNMNELLDEMAKKKILVEINLSSNQEILNVSGSNHPLALYMQHQVPVAISTDDEGVSRANISKQYELAVTDQHLNYLTLKQLSRNSLAFSFLPGNDLWVNSDYQQIVPECARDDFSAAKLSPTCDKYLSENEKAAMEWDLEKRFTAFEKSF